MPPLRAVAGETVTLAALFLSAALGAEVDALDEARFEGQAVGLHQPRAEAHKHAHDAKVACESILPADPRGLFCLYAAVAWAENGMGFGFAVDRDRLIRGGPICMDEGEVAWEASRFGIKGSQGYQADALWKRFHTDRTFAVWISVRRLWELLDVHGGAVFPALCHHNGGTSRANDWRVEYKYVPMVLHRHYRLWEEGPPTWLPCP